MARLVQEACVLQYEEHELIGFFCMSPPLDEDACSYTFIADRDGLRLEFTIFPLDGSVFTSLYREGVVSPIVKNRLSNCTHLQVKSEQRCLETGRPTFPTSGCGVSPIITSGLRLAIDPHIAIEFIHE